jgi:hypothetical protein
MAIARISLPALRAAAQAASTDRARYYLNGVLVEISARQAIYVATDGHVLFACRDPLGEDEPDNDLVGNWIVPTATITLAKIDKKLSPAAVLEGGDAGSRLILRTASGDLEFSPVDGTFPDWRRIVPREVERADPIQFDPARLARLWKAGAIVGAPEPPLAPNGGGPALVLYADNNAVGLIMPLRCDITAASSSPPDWALPTRVMPETAAAE